MRVLTSQQMRDADRRTTEEIGIPSLVLMENAGRQVVASMEAAFDDLASLRIAVICGKGNNGGDGFVVARTLSERGIETSVFLVGVSADVRGDARVNLGVLRALDIDVVEIADAATWELHGSDVLAADIIVDAIFGTGLSSPVAGLVETIIADLNACSTPVVAVDVPTGLRADSADVIGPAVAATLTVTLGAPKAALVLPPAERQTGRLVIADIGIPQSVVESLDGPWLELITKSRKAALVTPRVAESQKGDYGRIFLVAGSRGKTGAAHLAAAGALRSGAGLVTVATPASCQPILATLGVEYMTEALEETSDGQIGFEAVDRILDADADVIAIGPGLGRSPSTMALVQAVVERAGVPLVIDADALFAFAAESDRLMGRDDAEIIITPHPGEMARLTGLSIEAVQADRVGVARTFAMTHRVHVVLKGHRTVVATPDGKAYINLTGNPGMASGGTGDVLTGVIAAWFAQLLDTSDAAQLAVYLHGLAGDLAAADEGEIAMVATDLVDRLGDAVLELTSTHRREVGESASE
ncbi:MAG: NAD(P)H-hydrate dehydratase [Vicinamibacterales bacterium]